MHGGMRSLEGQPRGLSAGSEMPAVERPALVVLDASVAVRWVVPERGSDEAAALLGQSFAWLAPRLLVTEVASALRRKVSGGEISGHVASHALGTIVDAIDDGVIQLAEDEHIVAAALTLAITLDRKLPDCLYLALAEREGAALATADRGLSLMARNRGVRVLAIPSA
jgi:predicted nucleic acid-binding protein